MLPKRLPKSIRKFLREEKARIRHEFIDPHEAEGKISELRESIYKKYGPKDNERH